MKKLLIGAAIAAIAGVAFVGQGQAAPATAQDPMCKMGNQSSNQNWMDHYKCWQGPAVKIAAPKPSKKDPMCSLGAQSGSQSWAAHYHCW